jgi:hypothetical protein
MTPFLQFRLWLRQGPGAERTAAALVALIVAGLFAWALVPIGDDHSDRGALGVNAMSPEGAPSQEDGGPGDASTTTALAGGVTAPVGGTGSSGTTRTGSSTGQASTSATTTCPSGNDQGVDDKTIHIAVALPNIQGQAGNSLVGLPSYEDQIKFVQAAIDDQNKRHGGAACRSIEASYYDANPIDAAGAQQKCLDIVQSKPFAVIDSVFGYIAGVSNCLPQHQLPTASTSFLFPSQIKDYYPYVFSSNGQWDRLLHDWIRGIKQLGWFDSANGFKKLGVLLDDCFPEVNKLFYDELAGIGMKKSDVEEYNFGGSTCGAIPPANQYQQAVLNFTRAGVTNVADVVAPTSQSNYFSRVAAAQRAKFNYSLPDRGAITTFESAGFSPDADNFDGALLITPMQYGALKSGIPVSASTKRCNDAMAAAGMPSVEQSGVNFAGVACNFVWMMAAAFSHAPSLTRTNFIVGLNRSGAIDFSYPTGPAKFDKAGVVAGGQFWRPVRYDGKCPCFKVADPAFKPNFG